MQKKKTEFYATQWNTFLTKLFVRRKRQKSFVNKSDKSKAFGDTEVISKGILAVFAVTWHCCHCFQQNVKWAPLFTYILNTSGLVFILLCCLFNPSQCCLQATSGKSLANKCPSEYISHFISPTFISGRRMGTETQGLMGKYIIISKNLSPQKIIITPDNVIATGPHHTSASVYFCVVYLPQWLFFAVLPECSMGTWPYGHSCTIRHLHSLRHPIFSPWIKINRPLRFHTCWQASTTRPCEMYLPRRNNNLSQLIFK